MHAPAAVLRSYGEALFQYRREGCRQAAVIDLFSFDALSGRRQHTSCDAVVDRGTYCIHICPRADRSLCAVLLHRAEALAHRPDSGRAVCIPAARHQILSRAHIQQHQLACRCVHEIVWLDVPVDDPLPVRLFKILHHGRHQSSTFRFAQDLLRPDQSVSERLAFNKVHDDIGRLVFTEGSLHARHMLELPQLACILCLIDEALAAVPEPLRILVAAPVYGAAVRHRARGSPRGVVFFDAHRNIQPRIKAQVGDAEATLSHGSAHRISSVQDRAAFEHMFRLLFRVARVVKSAVRAHGPGRVQLPHTAVTAFEFHFLSLRSFIFLTVYHRKRAAAIRCAAARVSINCTPGISRRSRSAL